MCDVLFATDRQSAHVGQHFVLCNYVGKRNVALGLRFLLLNEAGRQFQVTLVRFDACDGEYVFSAANADKAKPSLLLAYAFLGIEA
jgi:hypothetical protein